MVNLFTCYYKNHSTGSVLNPPVWLPLLGHMHDPWELILKFIMKTLREPFLATQVKGNENWTCWLVNLWVLILFAWIFKKHIILMTLLMTRPRAPYLSISPTLSLTFFPSLSPQLIMSFFSHFVRFFNWGQHHLLDFRCCSRCCIFGSVLDYFKKCNISCVLSKRVAISFQVLFSTVWEKDWSCGYHNISMMVLFQKKSQPPAKKCSVPV